MIYGYVRTSTEDQVHGLASQEDRIRAEVARRGWPIPSLRTEHASARTLARPQLTLLLSELRAGDTLIVTDVDRLSRSVLDFTNLLARAHDEEWYVVVLGLVDTTTPEGAFVATVLAAVAELERRMLSQRTSRALRAAQARGIKVGRPADSRFDVQVQALHTDGLSFAAIAKLMQRATGEVWHPSRARRAYQRR